PFDPAVQLLANARQKFATVTDYTCTLVKQERIRGQMQPENVIAMKVRNQPYSVYMYWHAPKNFAGQEVCYVAGRNNGMMRVHSAGLLKMAGWVSVDPADPRAQQHSRHRIDEGGIGNLIERTWKGWQEERQLNKSQVIIAEYEFNKRRCLRVEISRPDRNAGKYYCYRSVTYFDKETSLPV